MERKREEVRVRWERIIGGKKNKRTKKIKNSFGNYH
jgi:hypothetical protein